MLSSNNVRDSLDVATPDTEWKTAKGKGKRGSQAAEIPPKSAAASAVVAPTTVKVASKAPVKRAPAVQAPVQTEAAADPAKRLKNLRKKLREIEAVEQKAAAGVKLEKDQLEKIARKADIMQEIEDLE